MRYIISIRPGSSLFLNPQLKCKCTAVSSIHGFVGPSETLSRYLKQGPLMAYACAVSYLVAITIVLWDIKYLNSPHKQEAGGEGRGNKAFRGRGANKNKRIIK